MKRLFSLPSDTACYSLLTIPVVHDFLEIENPLPELVPRCHLASTKYRQKKLWTCCLLLQSRTLLVLLQGYYADLCLVSDRVRQCWNSQKKQVSLIYLTLNSFLKKKSIPIISYISFFFMLFSFNVLINHEPLNFRSKSTARLTAKCLHVRRTRVLALQIFIHHFLLAYA